MNSIKFATFGADGTGNGSQEVARRINEEHLIVCHQMRKKTYKKDLLDEAHYLMKEHPNLNKLILA